MAKCAKDMNKMFTEKEIQMALKLQHAKQNNTHFA